MVQEPARPDPDRQAALPLWELVQTGHVVARAFHQTFARAGLTPQQFGVLEALSRDPDATPAALARTIMVRPQSLWRVIDAMVTGGLLERATPTGRGRATRLTITPSGDKRLQDAWPLVEALNHPGNTGLTPTQAEHLCRMLAAVREHLDG